jgi:hypothetical protein
MMIQDVVLERFVLETGRSVLAARLELLTLTDRFSKSGAPTEEAAQIDFDWERSHGPSQYGPFFLLDKHT